MIGAPLLLWLGLRAAPAGPPSRGALAGAWLLGALALLASPDLGWQGIVFSWYYVPPALIWLALLLRRRGGTADPPARRGSTIASCCWPRPSACCNFIR